MIRNKSIFLSILFVSISFSAISQTIKGYTKAEIEEYSSKVEDQIRFLEYLLNTVGSADTPPRDKDVVIRESYLKIFRDGQVQIEDDLLLDRQVVTNKDVTAYMKDIEFFYKDANFKFKIRDVKPNQMDNGEVFFVASLDRTLTAKDLSGKNITNTKPRFIEVNLDPKSQELKIASIYTTKLSRDEELKEWWGIIDPAWQDYFRNRFGLSAYDSIDVNQLYKFVSVDSLDISGTTSLADLSPLEALRQLKYVDLSNTQITELGPISNVTFLEYLDVSNTPTSDIQFIKYSDRLKYLDISETQISDIAELVNLKSLQSVKAVKTPILSFATLNEFDSLKHLNLSASGFNNAENIKDLTQLEELDISNNYLINFSSLGNLQSLKNLNLAGTNIQDLSSLDSLNQLEVVNLTGTEVSDISSLSKMSKLTKVLADETKLSVIAADNFIRANPNVLLIHHVKDLESWWTGLSEEWKTSLRAANPQISGDSPRVEVLTQTIGLEELDLSGAGIASLNPITRFVKLRKVDFSDNPVQDVIPLSEVKTLHEIVGKNTSVSDLAPLKSNTALKSIVMDGSPVASIKDLMELPDLSFVNVNASSIPAEEVPVFLARKPESILVYRTEELTQWWVGLDQTWQGIFRAAHPLSEQPTTAELHSLTGKPALNLERVSVGNLDALTAFVNLRSLVIFDAPITSITPIHELALLENLRISQVPVTDFCPVSVLKNLKTLDISNTGIEDLTSLSNLTSLEELNISGTSLRNLKGLEGLTALKVLDVASTNLRSLRPIEGLPNLEMLSCFNTRVNSRNIQRFKDLNPNCEVRYY